MKQYIVRFLWWALARLATPAVVDAAVAAVITPMAAIDLVPPPVTKAVFVEKACVLVRQAEKLDASGEYKRHWVYAQLIKEFPKTRRRSLSAAIEQAMLVLD